MVSIIALKHEFSAVVFVILIKPELCFMKRIALIACFDFECKSTFLRSYQDNEISLRKVPGISKNLVKNTKDLLFAKVNKAGVFFFLPSSLFNLMRCSYLLSVGFP